MLVDVIEMDPIASYLIKGGTAEEREAKALAISAVKVRHIPGVLAVPWYCILRRGEEVAWVSSRDDRETPTFEQAKAWAQIPTDAPWRSSPTTAVVAGRTFLPDEHTRPRHAVVDLDQP